MLYTTADYYLRALALEPNNSMIKLSLAIGYIHYALKRQAENRQRILMQGFAFFLQYYDEQDQSGNLSRLQEAEYNIAHSYHLLGLTHLAIPHYERCLELSKDVQTKPSRYHTEDSALEAAFNLQQIWAANGDTGKACALTERWMVL